MKEQKIYQMLSAATAAHRPSDGPVVKIPVGSGAAGAAPKEETVSELEPRWNLVPVAHDPFAGAAIVDFTAVTPSQSEIWLAAALDPQVNLAYNEGVSLHLAGRLDVAALERSLRQLIARHDSLRAVFSLDGRFMSVLDSLPLQLEVIEVDGEAAVAPIAEQLMHEHFDLAQGPMLRCTLVRTAPERQQLLLIVHHIVCDGWGLAQLLTELSAIYSAEVGAAPFDLPTADRYTEYAALERRFAASDDAARQLQWWIAQLDGAPNAIELPLDFARPAKRSYRAGRVDHRLPRPMVASLRKLASEQRSSLVMLLLSVFSAQLHRLIGADDMVIGLAAAGQLLHERPRLVGHCVNFLPLRLRPRADQTLGELLQQTRQVLLDAYDHQAVTFGQILPHLQLDREDGRPPLISVAFNVDVRDDPIEPHGLKAHYDTLQRTHETFEVYLNIVDDGTDLVLECCYSSELFGAQTMQRRLREYERLLGDAASLLGQPLQGFELISAAERQRVLEDFNPAAGAVAQRQELIHEAIAEQVRRRPDAVAVVAGDTRLSYAQLWTRSGAIAAELQARGVARGEFVGVCLPREADLACALLGVLRSGGAYLPLDPELPASRLGFMIGDAGVRLCLAVAGTRDALAPAVEAAGATIVDLGSPLPPREPQAVALAGEARSYAIYTSGSTGQPKGVVAHHRGVLNCLAGTRERIGFGESDALLAIATYAFDASVLEIFLPLVTGGRLVVAGSADTVDGARLAAVLEQQHISHVFTAPAAWRLLLSAGWAGDRKLTAISWAEPLTPDLAAALIPKVGALWNCYGPTETTVWMLGARITDAAKPITIGSPIPNMRAYVLDAQRNPVSVGVVGELYVGGVGVTHGYLNRPELQAERFGDDPFADGRLYRTGDLARWTEDGEIVCLGRIDHQVKLRGYRIELGEIEALLQGHAEIESAACAVVERAPGDERLVAWLQRSPQSTVGAAELRRHLRGALPTYMVPQHFVLLDALPRLHNGKLDRRSLPSPFASEATPARRAPGTETEIKIAALWREVLAHDAFGADDRFLDVGGHSLLTVQMAQRLQQTLGIKLDLRQIMTGTLAQIAAACDAALTAPPLPPPPAALKASAAAAAAAAEAAKAAAKRGFWPWQRRGGG